MKKLLALISIMSFALIVFAVEKGPEIIDLSKEFNIENPSKKPVMFQHALHQTKNECTDCHMSANGGKQLINTKTGELFVVEKTKGIGNDWHQNFCFPCHERMKVQGGKSCNTCHK